MDIDLSDLNGAYLSARGERFSDGIYPARLITAQVCRSKAGRRQVTWELEVMDNMTGRSILVKKYIQLTVGSVFWLHAELRKLGVTMENINDLHETLRGLAGSIIEIDLQSTGDWYTVEFIRLLSKPV